MICAQPRDQKLISTIRGNFSRATKLEGSFAIELVLPDKKLYAYGKESEATVMPLARKSTVEIIRFDNFRHDW